MGPCRPWWGEEERAPGASALIGPHQGWLPAPIVGKRKRETRGAKDSQDWGGVAVGTRDTQFGEEQIWGRTRRRGMGPICLSVLGGPTARTSIDERAP